MTRRTNLFAIVLLNFPSFHGFVATVTAIPCTPSVVIVVVAIAISLVISRPTGFFWFFRLRARGTAKVHQLDRHLDNCFETVLAGETVRFGFFHSGSTVAMHVCTW